MAEPARQGADPRPGGPILHRQHPWSGLEAAQQAGALVPPAHPRGARCGGPRARGHPQDGHPGDVRPPHGRSAAHHEADLQRGALLPGPRRLHLHRRGECRPAGLWPVGQQLLQGPAHQLRLPRPLDGAERRRAAGVGPAAAEHPLGGGPVRCDGPALPGLAARTHGHAAVQGPGQRVQSPARRVRVPVPDPFGVEGHGPRGALQAAGVLRGPLGPSAWRRPQPCLPTAVLRRAP
mmetsp:Transcript_4532/g.8073  ORF Transcript_4532/g.8073 Transcript_4532/m.8073 type:complete len:235 (-) Transcript_4532:2523-3227(-)